jgi:hypothetical protein
MRASLLCTDDKSCKTGDSSGNTSPTIILELDILGAVNAEKMEIGRGLCTFWRHLKKSTMELVSTQRRRQDRRNHIMERPSRLQCEANHV